TYLHFPLPHSALLKPATPSAPPSHSTPAHRTRVAYAAHPHPQFQEAAQYIPLPTIDPCSPDKPSPPPPLPAQNPTPAPALHKKPETSSTTPSRYDTPAFGAYLHPLRNGPNTAPFVR